MVVHDCSLLLHSVEKEGISFIFPSEDSLLCLSVLTVHRISTGCNDSLDNINTVPIFSSPSSHTAHNTLCLVGNTIKAVHYLCTDTRSSKLALIHWLESWKVLIQGSTMMHAAAPRPVAAA